MPDSARLAGPSCHSQVEPSQNGKPAVTFIRTSDDYRYEHGRVCGNKPVRADYLDKIVWDHITGLLADPSLIRTEINNRLAQHHSADPATAQRTRLDAGLTKTNEAIKRLISAYQEELISLDELRTRMPELRAREAGLRQQLDALDSQLADRDVYLRLADNLEDFLTGLHDKTATATVTERQRVLRLLVKDVLVSPDKITIRHSIPIRNNATKETNGSPETDSEGEHAEIANCVGGVLSPVLANLFLHYAFDAWMTRTYPGIQFERYADDVIVHCDTEQQAQRLLAAIEDRLGQVGLQVNPAKTKIVYCKDGRRRGDHDHVAFTFLGFTFRARAARSRSGAPFTGFLPAVSKQALMAMRAQVRRWRLHLRNGLTLADLAQRINPIVRGWMQYYGAFYRSALDPLLKRVNSYLVRFLRRKFRRLRPFRTALACWSRITRQQPTLFAHGAWGTALW